jgi:hypothetical protein
MPLYLACCDTMAYVHQTAAAPRKNYANRAWCRLEQMLWHSYSAPPMDGGTGRRWRIATSKSFMEVVEDEEEAGTYPAIFEDFRTANPSGFGDPEQGTSTQPEDMHLITVINRTFSLDYRRKYDLAKQAQG